MHRGIVVALLICGLAVAALGPLWVGAEQSGAGYEPVALDDSARSALARDAGGGDRHSLGQGLIFWMLATLLAATLVLGIFTILYALGQNPARTTHPAETERPRVRDRAEAA